MKRLFFLQSLICLLVVSCSVQDLDTREMGSSPKDVFHAYLESYAGPETKVYVDERIKLHWDKDDRLSMFNKTTYNDEYRFEGMSGDKAGQFSAVETDVFVTGNPVDYICAIYPYNSSIKLDNNDVLKLTLPEMQSYREGSFGRGANLMVSVTTEKDSPLEFKNVGGYMVIYFYGEGVSVSSIKLEGKNDERLSGEATMEPAVGEFPVIKMAADKATSITLLCENAVELDANKENATVFWMVVPPTTFEKGFKLTVTGSNGKEFIKETDKVVSISRNTLFRIAPIEVTFK